MIKSDFKVDFIIAWVDGSDIHWRNEKSLYEKENVEQYLQKWNDGKTRYRDWGLLKYWFRGIENFAPWVNRIHFVTWGHIPTWLNVEHPKLNIVKHSDYIPDRYLPTFNSHCIELNFHRIKNLANNFVYFNDDMFLTNKVNKEDFFINGIPCDTAIISPVQMKQNGIRAEINNMYAINAKYRKNDVIKQNVSKWFSYKYGKMLIRTLLMLPFNDFTGFYVNHLPCSYNRITFEYMWKLYPKILDTTCRHKFRNTTDVNQWLAEYLQFVEGDFSPRSPSIGRVYEGKKDYQIICQDIKKQKYKMICFNDSVQIEDPQKLADELKTTFEHILPRKSEFEIC